MTINVDDIVQTNKGRAKIIETDGVIAIGEYEDRTFVLIDVVSVKKVRDNIIKLVWSDSNGQA